MITEETCISFFTLGVPGLQVYIAFPIDLWEVSQIRPLSPRFIKIILSDDRLDKENYGPYLDIRAGQAWFKIWLGLGPVLGEISPGLGISPGLT